MHTKINLSDSCLYEALQIRYVKLHFTILFPEASSLPVNKVSALRGGMGEMLLRANCVRDRQCEICDFETECIVHRTMYSKFEKKPAYITNHESIGYVLECENYRTDFPAGSTLDFNLILFGKTIVYLNQYLQALYALGMNGLGAEHAIFQILSMTNTRKQDIIIGSNVYMKKYVVQHISDYVEYRMTQLKKYGLKGRLVFKTPLCLNYQNEFLQEFQMDAIINAIKRRIHMLDFFEGMENDFYHGYQVSVPEIRAQEHRFVKIKRYSSRKDSHMFLKGIEGFAELTEIPMETLPLLLAGELIHIGKNTSFGFGRYQVW